MALAPFPVFDPNVEYIGVEKLRLMNTATIRSLRNPLAVVPRNAQDGSKPVAVIVRFEEYLELLGYAMKYLDEHPPG